MSDKNMHRVAEEVSDHASAGGAESSSSSLSVESIRVFLAEKLGFFTEREPEDTTGEKVIENLTFDGVMEHWRNGKIRNIITMVGAGISTSAGIPDFRSPGSGLYHNLEKYNLPHPTAIFELSYFQRNPKPFFVLAKELYPGSFKPTPCHYFVRLLEEKGLLLRHYTQNIDTLERIAGISDEKLVEAHGTFYTNHCLSCGKEFTMEWMKDQIFADLIPNCDECKGVVKPDIVFFGETLPDKFYSAPRRDFDKCDLLIIMGTSLEVQPFASLVDHAPPNCLRLLINREKVGQHDDILTSWLFFGRGLSFDSPNNKRDVAWVGDCDDGVYAMADALGFGEELRDLVNKEHDRIDREIARAKKVEEDAKAAAAAAAVAAEKDAGQSSNVCSSNYKKD